MYNQYGYGNYMPQQNYQSPTQQRLAQMEQMQMQQNQQMQQQQQVQQHQQPQSNIIAVASIEEVKAYPVDWSGNANYFIDNVNNRIYTKQVGLDGIPRTNIYTLDNSPLEAPQPTSVDYVSKEEFNNLKSEIDQYKNIIQQFINQGGQDNAK